MQSLAVYLYIDGGGLRRRPGLLSSFVQLVSGQPMRFGLEPKSLLASIGGVLLRVLAGPAILMRNAWRGLRLQSRPKVWFGVSAADRGGLEPVLGGPAARSDPDAVNCLSAEKKSRPLGEAGSSKGPVGSGMGGG